MDEYVNKIIASNKELFGEKIEINKINVGFTNAIYVVNNTFVIKICINKENETNFIKEIGFYKSNEDNNLIPKLYYSSTDKKEIPYYYEILEKVEGISLYNIWHTLNEIQREDIIKQLCVAMKIFHSNVKEDIDWNKEVSELFVALYEKANLLSLFNVDEQEIINDAYLKFSQFLESKDFVLVHNDLHFDNILYNNGQIKLIDFERSIYAPRDFELDILYRMIRKPWKFASEETEGYVKLSDYENIMKYIEKYYSKLICIDNLYQRLAIYDMVYFLKHFINNPKLYELKEDIMNAAKIVVSK